MTDTRVAAVVGGHGLIGSAICSALSGHGWDVVVVEPQTRGDGRDGSRYGDLLVPDTLPRALAGADVVVQCATFRTHPVEKPKLGHTFMNFDARGTASLVAAAERVGCRRYIYVSGSGVPSANPEGAKSYFQAMYHGEQAVLNSRLEGVCLRPTLVYGPRDRTVNQIVALGRRLPVVPVLGSGRQRYQPVYIGDVAEIARQAAEPGGPQGIFEVGGPERMSFEQLIRTALAAVGIERPLLRIPLGPVRLAARVLQRLPGPPITVAAVDFAGEDDVADLAALRGSFDIQLTLFEEGLSRYLSQVQGTAR